uniref:Uncharacterized protein n=1 Tax=Borely moumouvirus TaxID=2712067 RepID=A0A6G6ADC0_9VIRU
MFLTVEKIIKDIAILYPEISGFLSLIFIIHRNEILRSKKLTNSLNKKQIENKSNIHDEISSIRQELENIIFELKKING